MIVYMKSTTLCDPVQMFFSILSQFIQYRGTASQFRSLFVTTTKQGVQGLEKPPILSHTASLKLLSNAFTLTTGFPLTFCPNVNLIYEWKTGSYVCMHCFHAFFFYSFSPLTSEDISAAATVKIISANPDNLHLPLSHIALYATLFAQRGQPQLAKGFFWDLVF